MSALQYNIQQNFIVRLRSLNKKNLTGLVIIFPNLRAFFRGTFEKFPPCSQIFKFCEGDFCCYFSAEKQPFLQHPVTQQLTNSNFFRLPQRRRVGLAARPLRLCDKAAVALQRGPCRNATAASSQPRESLTAKKRGFFRSETGAENSQKFSFQKGRKALTGPEGVKRRHIPELRSNDKMGQEALTGHQNKQEQSFLQTAFCKYL